MFPNLTDIFVFGGSRPWGGGQCMWISKTAAARIQFPNRLLFWKTFFFSFPLFPFLLFPSEGNLFFFI